MHPTLTKYLGSIVGVALNIALVLGILGYFGIQTTSIAAMLAGADAEPDHSPGLGSAPRGPRRPQRRRARRRALRACFRLHCRQASASAQMFFAQENAYSPSSGVHVGDSPPAPGTAISVFLSLSY